MPQGEGNEDELPIPPWDSIEPYLEERRETMVENQKCDVDDLLCQITALSHLKGLKSVLGGEKYQAEFPELQGLDEKISGREATLRETLGRCGLDQTVEPELISEPTEEVE